MAGERVLQVTVRVAYLDLPTLVGRHLGPGSAVEVSQDRIDAFAKCTLDEQWIHVDVDRARRTALGTTIAPGFLTLSLLSCFLGELLVVDDAEMAINYGLDRVRFPSPVRAGSWVCGSVDIGDVAASDGFTTLRARTTFWADEDSKPCCVADSVTRFVPRQAAVR
jgi:acyl dehydratase